MFERAWAFGATSLAAGTALAVLERVIVAAFTAMPMPTPRGLFAWWGASVALGAIIFLAASAGDVLRRWRAAGGAGATVLGAVAVAAVLALLGAPLGESLTTGGWISQQSWGWLLRAAPSAALAGAGFTLFALETALRSRPTGWRVAGALLGGAATAVVAVDHHVLLGTYPDLHVTFLALAALLLTFALRSIRWLQPAPRNRWLSAAIATAALAAGSLWLTLPLGHRPALSMASSMASTLMEFTMPRVDLQFAEREFSRIDLREGSYLGASATGGLPRTDWNVLWITVDTLRWDALWPARTDKANFARSADTPFLNSWLRRTVLFDHAYAQSSATHRSMPPMFRSLEANEPALEIGTPLGAAAPLGGRPSVAVVNNFFLEPRYKSSQSLLWGFEDVNIYNKEAQEELVPLLDQAIGRHKETGFFAWLHFYNMHDPGYADGGMITKGSLPSRYRRSLKWLDSRMKEVVDVIARHGLAERTIVVFSADHGEGLGANRIRNHGPTVYEEEVRVPLAFFVPGVPARRVSTTVGNIDIVPTLWDAMGLERGATFRGRSLLPAFLGRPLEDRSYYMENSSGQTVGVVLGDQKLIHKKKSGTTMRFDLVADPQENENLFTDGPADQPLLAALYERNPDLVVATPVMGELAAATLTTMDPAAPGQSLRYVAQIAARSDVGSARRALVRVFDATPHDAVKLEILAAMRPRQAELAGELAERELERMDAAREAKFVRGLAEIGLNDIDMQVVANRFAGARPIDDTTAAAWLRWLARWKKPGAAAPVVANIARDVRAKGRVDAGLGRAIAVLAAAIKPKGKDRDDLLEFNRWLIEQGDPRVLPDAIATAGALADKKAFDAVRNYARVGPVRARQAALYALVAIDAEAAVDPIVEAAGEPELVLDAIKALERTRSPRAIPFIEGVVREHYNPIIRNNAKDALKKLRK